MHELAVTQNILEISLRYAQEAGAKRIVNINLRIGSLSSIVDDSVQFYWPVIARGTIAEEALLHFNRLAAEMVCLECGHTFEPSSETFSCPQCKSGKVKITKGEEFLVESIDID